MFKDMESEDKALTIGCIGILILGAVVMVCVTLIFVSGHGADFTNLVTK